MEKLRLLRTKIGDRQMEMTPDWLIDVMIIMANRVDPNASPWAFGDFICNLWEAGIPTSFDPMTYALKMHFSRCKKIEAQKNLVRGMDLLFALDMNRVVFDSLYLADASSERAKKVPIGILPFFEFYDILCDAVQKAYLGKPAENDVPMEIVSNSIGSYVDWYRMKNGDWEGFLSELTNEFHSSIGTAPVKIGTVMSLGSYFLDIVRTDTGEIIRANDPLPSIIDGKNKDLALWFYRTFLERFRSSAETVASALLVETGYMQEAAKRIKDRIGDEEQVRIGEWEITRDPSDDTIYIGDIGFEVKDICIRFDCGASFFEYFIGQRYWLAVPEPERHSGLLKTIIEIDKELAKEE